MFFLATLNMKFIAVLFLVVIALLGVNSQKQIFKDNPQGRFFFLFDKNYVINSKYLLQWFVECPRKLEDAWLTSRVSDTTSRPRLVKNSSMEDVEETPTDLTTNKSAKSFVKIFRI
ncbi:hypothetical protein ACFFRR_004814 [Megaselia abdita]